MDKNKRLRHQNGDDRPPKGAHRHMEAFCLMGYHCEQCLLTEVLWNSRDGVTPMFLSCRACGGRMHHETWEHDKYAPNHVPLPGQRLFIDMPDSLKAPTARYSIWLGLQMGNPLPPDRTAEQIAQSIVEGFHEGEPFVITWPR